MGMERFLAMRWPMMVRVIIPLLLVIDNGKSMGYNSQIITIHGMLKMKVAIVK